VRIGEFKSPNKENVRIKGNNTGQLLRYAQREQMVQVRNRGKGTGKPLPELGLPKEGSKSRTR